MSERRNPQSPIEKLKNCFRIEDGSRKKIKSPCRRREKRIQKSKITVLPNSSSNTLGITASGRGQGGSSDIFGMEDTFGRGYFDAEPVEEQLVVREGVNAQDRRRYQGQLAQIVEEEEDPFVILPPRSQPQLGAAQSTTSINITTGGVRGGHREEPF